MQAVVLNGFGGAEVLGIAEVPPPEPGLGQVRLNVMATSVNRADIVQREGNYPPPKGASEILGLEAAGVIDAVGGQVLRWKPGDRVMALLTGGGYAEYAVAEADQLLPIPTNMSFVEAGAVCETFLTAFLNVFRIGRLKPGQTLLIHGGGSGVGTAAIQMVKALQPECPVFVTASAAKADRLARLGVDGVIDYHQQDFAEVVRAHTDQRGVDVILDHIGGGYLGRNLKALAVGGRLVVIGLMGGAAAEINLGHLMVKRQQIIGSTLRGRPDSEKKVIVADFHRQVYPLIEQGLIAPLIDRRFELKEVQQAHRHMEAGGHFGKIVLQVS